MENIAPLLNGSNPIILFDGVCNLCSSTVQFVIARDPEARFRFASLQGETGQALLTHFGLKTQDFDTFVLVSNGTFYTKSTAILRGGQILGGVWSLLGIFWIVPRPIRDFFYSLIAKNRYRFFGEKSECWLPTPELRTRFL